MKFKSDFTMITALLTLFLVLGAGAAPSALAHEENKMPCAIDVIFEDDEVGVATFFVLRLQHKNQAGRPIDAVSVLVRNSGGEVIRNTDAVCGSTAAGLGPGSTGQCERILQVITGKMSNKAGYDRRAEMIDDQRRQIGKAAHCEVPGARHTEG